MTEKGHFFAVLWIAHQKICTDGYGGVQDATNLEDIKRAVLWRKSEALELTRRVTSLNGMNDSFRSLANWRW
jgi:hypothetical protein